MQFQTIPLKQIVAGDAVNVRADRKAGVKELAASIEATGLLQPLVVRPQGNKFEVIAGNRRFAALKKLKATEAPCHVVEAADAAAVAISLVENIDRLPIHEVDQFEAFAKMSDAGMAVADIASRYAISEKVVRQRLALGRLSPKARQMWRAGKIGMDIVKVLTITDDHAAQDKALAASHYSAWQVRQALGANSASDSYDMAIVGRDAYMQAGGRFREDLFSDDEIVADPDILNRLMDAAIAAEVERHKAKGWSFVVTEREARHYDYVDAQIDMTDEESAAIAALRADKKRPYEERQTDIDKIEQVAFDRALANGLRAQSGVFLGWDAEGFDARIGVIARENAPAPKSVKTSPEPDKPESAEPPIALLQSVSEQATSALASAVTANPKIAMRLAVAALVGRLASCVRLSSQGMIGSAIANMPADFEDALQFVAERDDAEVAHLFAVCVAGAIDLRDNQQHYASREAAPAIAKLVGVDTVAALLRERVDLVDYFKRAPRAVADAALAEIGAEPVPQSKKEGEVAARAAEATKAAGWLPPAVRYLVDAIAGVGA